MKTRFLTLAATAAALAFGTMAAEAKVKALTEANVPVPLRMHEVIDEVEKKLKSLAKV